MFQCYLDDSGTTDQPVVTMAGFVGHLEQWEALEPKFDAIMNSHGVNVFHSKEFHDTKPPFKRWSRVRKLSFVDELFTAAHGRLAGASVTLRRATVVKAKQDDPLGFAMASPLGLCFSAIMFKMVTDPNTSGPAKKDGISFLVESGNSNNGEIERYFHIMSKRPVFEGCLRSISFISKESCRAIQLADLFAFYSRRQMRNYDRFDYKIRLPACPYIETMQRHAPLWQKGGYGNVSKAGDTRTMSNLTDLQALMLKKKSFQPRS